MNWRSTHLRNGANDRVVVPNSAIAKMRIQNHSAGTKRYSGTLSVTVDSRNETEVTMELLRQAAMTCTKILKQPPTAVTATDIKGDRITYEISFNTASFSAAPLMVLSLYSPDGSRDALFLSNYASVTVHAGGRAVDPWISSFSLPQVSTKVMSDLTIR